MFQEMKSSHIELEDKVEKWTSMFDYVLGSRENKKSSLYKCRIVHVLI